MSSRHEFAGKIPGYTVALGWDNPLNTFFGQVERAQAAEDDRDPIILWIGGCPDEVSAPEALVAPLRRYFDLSETILRLLKADRLADADRAPTALQQTNLGSVTVRRRGA